MGGAEVRIRRLQSVQTQNMFDLTIAGNTVGAGGLLISSGTLTLVGGPNITLSQDGGNIITISGGAGGAGSFDAGVSNLGNTLGTTGTVSNEIVFVGGSNITLSQSSIVGHSATITIIGGAGGSFDAGVSSIGNTAGTTGTVSNEIVFVGGNNITLSQSSIVGGSATITISAFNQSTQPSMSAGVSNLGNSDGTTGTVSNQIVLVGGNNITLSQSINANSATITVNAFNQSIQTQSIIQDLVISGNTSGVTADITSGTITLAGGNNITLSQAGNAITISAFNQSVQTQSIIQDVNIVGNTSGVTADISSGTLFLAGGNSITLSQNGQSITISGATTSQSVQTQNVVDVTLSGNTSGVLALISSGTLTLAGGNNITLSQAGNAVTISGPVKHDVTIAGNSTSAGAGFALISTGTLTLAGGNRITLSQNGNAITISGPALGGSTHQHVIDGNTSGTTATMSSGILTLAGGNNITLSQAGNAVTISGPNTVAQSTQPAVGSLNGSSGTLTIEAGTNITISNNASTISVIGPSNILNSFSIGGNTGTTGSSAITGGGYVIAGGSNITLSQSNATISIHGASQSVQADSHNIIAAGTQTGNTSGTVIFSNSNNVSFGMSNSSVVTATATFSQSVQTQSTHVHIISGNTSGTTASMSTGTIVLAGGNNITLSQVGNAVTVSALASSSLVQSGNVSISTNGSTITISGLGFAYASLSAGNTSGTLTLISSGTMYLAGGNNITLSQNGNSITISGGTAAGAAFSAGVSSIGNTSGSTGTVSNQIVFVGGNNITLSQSTGGASSATITISAASQSVQTNSIINGVSISAGNTAGVLADITSGTLYLAGGNAITLSQNANSITISGRLGVSFGISNLGNTASESGTVSRLMVLVGSDNITLSGNVNAGSITVSIVAPSNIVSAAVIAGNTSGVTASISSGTMTLAGGNNITLSQAGNAITISGREVPTLSIWDNFFLRTGFGFYDAADRFALEELDIVDDVFPGNMTVSTAFFDVSATVNAGGTDNFGTVKLGIYTLNASTLSIHNSVSTAWTLGPLTGGGLQFMTIHSSLWSASPTFSQTKYWLGYIFHTHSDAAFSMSILGQSHLFTGARVGTFPSTLTISTAGQVPFVGTSAATRANTAALPTNIQLSQLVKSGGNYGIMPHLIFMNVSSNF